MCVSPIRIPNPNYLNKTPVIQKTKDTQSRYINVPCGVCSECVMSRQMSLVQRARNMALDHYIFFSTLTYDNEHLPRLVTSTGFEIPFADISDFQNMVKRIRKYNKFGREFKFYAVSERGSQKGRPHFHCLWFIPKNPNDDKLLPAQLETSLRRVVFSEWCRNYGTRKFPKYVPLFKYHQKYVGGKLYKNFDFHYVVPHSTQQGSDDVAFYCTKYLLKPSNKEIRLQQALRLNLSDEEYEQVWLIVKSKVLCSKHFGASTDYQVNYVKHCIENSVDNPTGLKYFIANGTPQPLSKYYRRFISAENGLKSQESIGSPIYDDDRDISQKLRSIEKGEIIKEKVRKRDLSELF